MNMNCQKGICYITTWIAKKEYAAWWMSNNNNVKFAHCQYYNARTRTIYLLIQAEIHQTKIRYMYFQCLVQFLPSPWNNFIIEWARHFQHLATFNADISTKYCIFSQRLTFWTKNHSGTTTSTTITSVTCSKTCHR